MVKSQNLIKLLLFETYLKVIQNSPKSLIFRNFLATVNGKKTDITRNGELSCAFFVAFILYYFKQLKSGHVTVDSIIKDLLKNNWQKITKPKLGAVIVWEKKKSPNGEIHKHIGFYIAKDQAISNSAKRRYPVRHHWTYRGKRKVAIILWKQF